MGKYFPLSNRQKREIWKLSSRYVTRLCTRCHRVVLIKQVYLEPTNSAKSRAYRTKFYGAPGVTGWQDVDPSKRLCAFCTVDPVNAPIFALPEAPENTQPEVSQHLSSLPYVKSAILAPQSHIYKKE